MTIQTKDDVLKKILSSPVPACPHCGKKMSLWEVPMMTFSDGLGWGEPYLYVCFNDQCPPFAAEWEHIQENYAHTASTRCFCYPSSGKFEFMPVFSRQGGRGQIIDEEILAMQEKEKQDIKKGFAKLAEAYASKDHQTALSLLLDAAQPTRVRLKAADMLQDLGQIESIEPITNHKFGNKLLEEAVQKTVAAIHERSFTRECPFCAEIIKARAKICKHCGKNVAGV